MLFRSKARAGESVVAAPEAGEAAAPVSPRAGRPPDFLESPTDISAALALVDVVARGLEIGLSHAETGKMFRLAMGMAELKIQPGKTGVDVSFQVPSQIPVQANDFDSFLRLLTFVDTANATVVADVMTRRLSAISGFSTRANAFGTKGDGSDIASTLLNMLTQSKSAPFEYIVKETKAFRKLVVLNGCWLSPADLSKSLATLGADINDGADLTRLVAIERLLGTATPELIEKLLRDIGREISAGTVGILPSPTAVGAGDFLAVLQRGETLLRAVRARHSAAAPDRTELAAALLEIAVLIDAAYREATLLPQESTASNTKQVERMGAKELFFTLRQLQRIDEVMQTKATDVAISTLSPSDLPDFPLNISLVVAVLESAQPAVIAAKIDMKKGRDGHRVRLQIDPEPGEIVDPAFREIVSRISAETGVNTVFGQVG